jgi:hypothetical protein
MSFLNNDELKSTIFLNRSRKLDQWSQDSLATLQGLGCVLSTVGYRNSIPWKEKKISITGPHPASYSMDNGEGGSFPFGKTAGESNCPLTSTQCWRFRICISTSIAPIPQWRKGQVYLKWHMYEYFLKYFWFQTRLPSKSTQFSYHSISQLTFF